MCDTLAATADATANGHVWLAKNSDREGDEAQHVEVLPARHPAGPTRRCTWIDIPDAPAQPVILSRPTWMWGAEMGVNASGVAIGNQAVFTRLPTRASGLTGMDLVRLALERATSAAHAVDVITTLIDAHGQGGSCSLRSSRYRYHNAFLIADPRHVWLLETADHLWAAQRLHQPTSISNTLTLGRDHHRIHPEAENLARQRGWWRHDTPLDFAAAFTDPTMRFLAGARERRACTLAHLQRDLGRIDEHTFLRALRDHGDAGTPLGPLRLLAPCSHSTALPTRRTGQTTASMIAHLHPDGPRVLMTGTPAPCLNVFKPVTLDSPATPGGLPGTRPDPHSLFWQAEHQHRAALDSWPAHPAWNRTTADALETEALEAWRNDPTPMDVRRLWAADRDRLAQLR